VLEPPLTTLPLVAPSLPSALKDKTLFLTTFLGPPFPLAQLTKLEVGGTFYVDAGVNEVDVRYESNNAFIEVHNLDEDSHREVICGCCGCTFT